MSLEKIKAMAEIAKQMEDMKNEVVTENAKERRQLRVEALYKIQEYFKDLVESLNGTSVGVSLPIHLSKYNQDKDYSKNAYNLEIMINSERKVTIWEYATSDYITIKDFTNQTETDFYRKSGENVYWNNGYIQLIEKWTEIKPLLESAIEKALISKMNQSQNELANFKASYEKVSDFKA